MGALLVALSSVCAAQESVGLQEAEELKPHGIRSGKLVIHPGLSYALTYTDNALRSRDNPQADVLQEFLPSFRLAFNQGGGVSLDLSYTLGWHDYLREIARDYLSHTGYGELKLRNAGIEGLSFSLGDRYLQSGNASALENELISFTRYEINESYLKTQYKYNRLDVSARYSYSFTNYFYQVDQDANFAVHTGQLEVSYDFVPERFRLYSSYAVARDLYEMRSEDDFDSHTLLVGVRGTYGKLAYSVGVGYAKTFPLHSNESDEGPATKATLIYTPHRRLNFSLAASRLFTAGVRTGASMDTNVDLAARVLLTPRGSIVATAALRDSDRLHTERLRTVSAVGAFEYKFTRFARASIGVTHTERSSPSGIGDFTINEAQVILRLEW